MLRHKIKVFQNTLRAESRWTLNQDLAEDLEKLEHGLRRFAQAGLWRDVGQMRFLPASSQILQRREGYRELFRLNALLTLRTQCNFDLPDFACILETKDTPTLYEYWAFFVIKDLLDKRFDMRSHDIVYYEVSDPKERKILFGRVLSYKEDVRLYFNRTFSARLESYSHDLRPDIVIEQGHRRLILDAKFKGSRPEESFNGGEEKIKGTIESWRKEDIDKMHAYRDAIVDVQGAFILFPGTETENKLFLPRDKVNSFPGVGALALRPGTDANADPEGIEVVAKWLNAFLDAAQPGAG
ncbi:protein of unknown function [Desulfonatronum zhilinae]|nr:protein of unknown function [Desulfonatronum zhilinae]